MTTIVLTAGDGVAASAPPRTLGDLATGQRARILALEASDPERLDALVAFGLCPGTEVTVRQRYPVIIIAVGETTLAVDAEVAADIRIEAAD